MVQALAKFHLSLYTHPVRPKKRGYQLILLQQVEFVGGRRSF